MPSNNQIILASSSPQRKDLLLQIGINPSKIVHPNLDENKHKDIFPSKLVQELAVKKALIVLKKFGNNKFFIISGDTIVCRSRKIFKKTNKKEIIKKYLEELSGRRHKVYGGICIISPKGTISKKLVTTEVFFNKISKNEYNEDLLNEGKNKAGGYSIQGQASKFVKKIRGSYTNIVGLSLGDVYNMLLGEGYFNT